MLSRITVLWLATVFVGASNTVSLATEALDLLERLSAYRQGLVPTAPVAPVAPEAPKAPQVTAASLKKLKKDDLVLALLDALNI